MNLQQKNENREIKKQLYIKRRIEKEKYNERGLKEKLKEKRGRKVVQKYYNLTQEEEKSEFRFSLSFLLFNLKD